MPNYRPLRVPRNLPHEGHQCAKGAPLRIALKEFAKHVARQLLLEVLLRLEDPTLRFKDPFLTHPLAGSEARSLEDELGDILCVCVHGKWLQLSHVSAWTSRRGSYIVSFMKLETYESLWGVPQKIIPLELGKRMPTVESFSCLSERNSALI